MFLLGVMGSNPKTCKTKSDESEKCRKNMDDLKFCRAKIPDQNENATIYIFPQLGGFADLVPSSPPGAVVPAHPL